MKPIIGIVGRSGIYTDSDVKFNSLFFAEKCRMCIIKGGGTPIGILPSQIVEYNDSVPSKLPSLSEEEKEVLISQIKLCDGILFPGGTKRFNYDLFILNYALEHDIPILGICLGMQIFTMVDENGNSVVSLEKIESDVNHSDYLNSTVHSVTISKDSKLYQIIGEETFMVNSKHKMKIVDPSTFKIYGYSSDGIPELIERHDKKFAIGVQWHPEVLALSDEKQMNIFRAFVDACKK